MSLEPTTEPVPAPRPTESRPDRPGQAEDCRCTCGALLARLVPGGVEIKCRRCHHTVVVPLQPPHKR